ncbi:DNA repair protein RadA [Erythrobacter aureus]|uniref:DNA repair protein RadA n=1 Tax=Erythrobacter aureus TaxID=2182384 RepID=A0A345YIJ8_9SPHN|nr:DNA repair protein RadA [Erythrobacter aureus]AXK43750.1 DNA repair protein RadA [Erythrobacter aureus]
MAKPKKRFVCTACGGASTQWSGQCSDCSEWNTLQEDAGGNVTPFSAKHDLSSGGSKLSMTPLNTQVVMPERLKTGIGELDTVLGGGIVHGSATLLGGEPGIGKSTLLIQTVAQLARAGNKVAYVSGEESDNQVRLRAQRLGLADAPVELASGSSVRDILTTMTELRPEVLIVDSIQTVHSDQIEGAPGTVSQVRACSNELIGFAKKTGTALILVGHVTKDGNIAGPRVLEHMVDTVLSFEGDRSHQFRMLRAVKNRFGGTDEIGVFSMGEKGLEEVTNPSSLFLTERDQAVSGSVVFPALEGTRPVLVEIQALVVRLQSGATPRRSVVGWDNNRLSMVLAVLESRYGLSFSNAEVYLAVSGGYRINDPGADLAVAMALVSALADQPVPNETIAFGEISLSGEIRSIAHMGLRLKEAAKLGFTKAVTPRGIAEPPKGIRVEAHQRMNNMIDDVVKKAG